LTLSFLIPIFWQNTTNLSTWKLNYPLLLGNEKTGDRPWSGYISEVSIADRAFSQRDISLLFDSNFYLNTVKHSLIADYNFTSKRKNITLIDQLPELVSQGKSSNIGDVKGVACIAFLRICSGKFEKDMVVNHARTGKTIRLSHPQKLFAQERDTVDVAYAGDVVGLNNPGTLAIGDTVYIGEKLVYPSIPSFSPELFAALAY
jgi:translation elongation factor EF-G